MPAASAAEAELTGPYAALMKAVEKGLEGCDAAAHTRTPAGGKTAAGGGGRSLDPRFGHRGCQVRKKAPLFLPQLLQAASAAQSAFEEIKTAIAQKGEGSASKGRIVLATVKGDVHDIGKNIVRVILEKTTALRFWILAGRTGGDGGGHRAGKGRASGRLSAPDDHHPEKAWRRPSPPLRAAKLDCKIMVGGAVLTPEYAEKIGADWYAKGRQAQRRHRQGNFGVTQKKQIQTAEMCGLFSAVFFMGKAFICKLFKITTKNCHDCLA